MGSDDPSLFLLGTTKVREMEKVRKKLVEEIYSSMDENERFGLEFGLFPYEKCKDLNKEECLLLMELRRREKGKFCYE